MIYVIKSGDTLGAIASRNNTTVSAILAANPSIKNPNQISVGQRINIPASAPAGGGAPAGSGNPPAGSGGSSGGAAPGGSGGGGSQTGPWTLPDSGEARRLVASDFSDAARQLDCETAAVRAVAEVESGGRTGFDARRRPKILFEIHLFRSNTNRRFDRSHPHLSAPYSSPRRRQSYAKDQWQVIREAFALDQAAAVKSASWGMFQVLGSNYSICGWSSVRQFSADMFVSEAQHMRAFLGFCRANNLVRHLRTKNWAAFARGYNGPDYASNAYDTKMANAYRRYRNQ
jgi:LysM repeat protein